MNDEIKKALAEMKECVDTFDTLLNVSGSVDSLYLWLPEMKEALAKFDKLLPRPSNRN